MGQGATEKNIYNFYWAQFDKYHQQDCKWVTRLRELELLVTEMIIEIRIL